MRIRRLAQDRDVGQMRSRFGRVERQAAGEGMSCLGKFAQLVAACAKEEPATGIHRLASKRIFQQGRGLLRAASPQDLKRRFPRQSLGLLESRGADDVLASYHVVDVVAEAGALRRGAGEESIHQGVAAADACATGAAGDQRARAEAVKT